MVNVNDRSGELVEKFKLDRLLGEGGMGQVYLAQHQITDRWVAVKILHQEFSENAEILTRIKREAKAAALIGHPNIVEIIDSGVDQYGAPYIAMELLNGESLDDYLERTGPMPIDKACYIVADLLETLDAAHAKGVIHRDMKPENVFLQKQHKTLVPQVKILDFGISKFLTMDNQNMSLTRTGTVMGTPYYMSVEQAMGQKVDGRADIYSVGVILYQLLTTKLPYFDTNYNRVLLQIVAGEHAPVTSLRPEIPVELSNIIERSMVKERDDRYLDCLSFKEDLIPFYSERSKEEMFAASESKRIQVNEDLPTNSVPNLSNPDVIKNTLERTDYKDTPIGTLSTGEVVYESKGNKSKIIVIAIIVVIAIAVGGFFIFGGNKKSNEYKNQKEIKVASDMNVKPVDVKPVMKPVMKAVPKPMEPVIPSIVTLTFANTPRKAKIYLDGNEIKFPYKVKGKKGIHNIKITKRGYEPFETKIELNKDQKIRFTAHRKSVMRRHFIMKKIIRKPIMKKPIMRKPMKFDPNNIGI